MMQPTNRYHDMTLLISDLVNAVKQGDLTTVKHLTETDVDVNRSLEDNDRVVMIATRYGNLEMVKLLVEAGADINVWSQGETPLMDAAYSGNQEIYDYLYPLVNSNIRDHADQHAATAIRNALIRKERKARKDVGRFIEAALFRDLARVEAAIENKIDLDAIDVHGKTALMYAAKHFHIPIVELLLDAGADPNLINYRQNDGVGQGMSAFMYAAENFFDTGKHARIFEILQKAGADINQQGDKGYTALMFAAENGYLEAVKELNKLGVDLNIKDNEGNTALMIAEFNSHSRVVEFLKQAGAS